MNKLRRCSIFLVGMICCSFGIAFFIRSALGVSPITSIPYALYLILPVLSVGIWTILFNFALIFIQPLIDKEHTRKRSIAMQVAITCVFGMCIDIALAVLNDFQPSQYIQKLSSLITGCSLLAFGAYLELVADAVILPADAFLRAVERVTGYKYGRLRVISDVSMVAIAIFIALLCTGAILGVREGTIIAAFVTGTILTFYIKYLKSLTNFLQTATISIKAKSE